MQFKLLNSFGRQRKPFLFISDFKAENLEIIPLEDLQKEDIEFTINENYIFTPHGETLQKVPLSFDTYKKKI